MQSVRLFSTEGKDSQEGQDGQKIDFGFKKVDWDEKERMVGGVFSSVADSYDVMNDAMSLGVHRLWKNQFVDSIGPLKMRKVMNEKNEIIDEVPLKCLDVAGGTGDIAFRILDKAMSDVPRIGDAKPSVDIIVSDINADMLEVGKKRAVEKNIFHDL